MAKLGYCAIFQHKILLTKHEIMLIHAMSLNLPTYLKFTLLTAELLPLLRNVCVSVTSFFDELDERVIDTAVRQWRTRLCTCVKAKGGHFCFNTN